MANKTKPNGKAGSSDAIRAFIKNTRADSVFYVPGAHDGDYSVDDLLFRQAELALAAGDRRRALGLFRVYLGKAGRPGKNQVQLFTAASLTGDFPLAFKVLKELEKAGLRNDQRLDIANPWYRIHDKGLLAALLAALERYRPQRDTFHRLAYLLMLRSVNGVDDQAALARLTAGMRSAGRAAFRRRLWLYFKIGETALHHCHFREAEEIFSRVLREEPGLEDAAGRLAEVLLCAGKEAAAFGTLKKAARYHKVSIEVWEGELLLWLGRYEEAAVKLKAGTSAGHQLAWCWLGAALFKLGRTEEAAATLRKALSVRPEDNEARIWLAEALAAAGEAKEAQAQLRAALAVNPTDFWAWLTLAAEHLRGKEAREALALRLPLEAVARLAQAAGLPPRENYSGAELKLMLRRARALARGIRRNEDYLRWFWLGGAPVAAPPAPKKV